MNYKSEYAKEKQKTLEKKPPEKLTDKEKEFLVTMYHIEESEAGLL